MRILIAEDDTVSRRVLEATLARAGYEVLSVADGTAAATHLADDRAIQIAILDWMMPGLDGLGVLKRMRADPATAATAVMVYTASDDPQVGWDATRLGALDCVQKVGRFDDLRERISACLAAAGRQRPAAARSGAGGGAGC